MHWLREDDVMRNFVSEAIVGKPVGQADFFSGLMDWWNNLEPMYKYAIIGGAGLLVLVIIVSALKPKPEAKLKGFEELLRLKLMKELAE